MAVRPITDLLLEQRRGELLEEFSTQFNELVKAVDNSQKVGEITLKFKLKPSAAGAIEVIDELKVKLPTLPKGSSLFFPTVEGNLQTNDPRQKTLPGLQAVDTSPDRQNVKVAS